MLRACPPVIYRMYGMPKITGREGIGDVQDERLFTGCDVDRHKQERLSAMRTIARGEGVGMSGTIPSITGSLMI